QLKSEACPFCSCEKVFISEDIGLYEFISICAGCKATGPRQKGKHQTKIAWNMLPIKEKYDKLLTFCKEWSMFHLSENQLKIMENAQMGLNDFQKGNNQKLSDIALEARELLKEIGEI